MPHQTSLQRDPYLLHAFSLDMLVQECGPVHLKVSRVDELPRPARYRAVIGQLVVARMVADHLGVPDAWRTLLHPGTVSLRPGDVAYVARYNGSWPIGDLSHGSYADVLPRIGGYLSLYRLEVGAVAAEVKADAVPGRM